jgi:glyoxylase-like metal-dependent hydrolase (beta-lactamase superfamily II)
MDFLSEAEPERGRVIPVLPGVSRIVAPNPGPMTYYGTNTYLLESADGFAVLDPGPESAAHLQAVLTATGGRMTKILLSHTHRDHLDGLPALRAATGAPAYGFHHSAAPDFTPDHPLHDGEMVDGWTALHTPGHAADHLCFARADGVVFTADQVMAWSTSVVSPPNGDMAAYLDSLRRLYAREARLYLPGHGPAIREPRRFVRALIDHRIMRENAILSALRGTGAMTARELVDALYANIAPHLHGPAERSVLAHLQKLEAEGRAAREGETWRAG